MLDCITGFEALYLLKFLETVAALFFFLVGSAKEAFELYSFWVEDLLIKKPVLRWHLLQNILFGPVAKLSCGDFIVTL